MRQKKFGSRHTVEKLDCLERYLRAYLKVFEGKDWPHTVYVDAFAGTGEIPIASTYEELPLGIEDKDFIIGSARRALAIDSSFDQYIFIEKKRGNARALEHLKRDYPTKNVRILNTDANSGIQSLCSTIDWKKHRAVVFLDPFGSQVAWQTLEAIAKTEAIDLWYLSPAGLSVHRQLGTQGKVHYTHEESLNRIFGSRDWRTRFIDTVEIAADLFSPAGVGNSKVATPDSVTKYMHERMSSVFAGGVHDKWMPLGQKGGHWYSLMFACANPSPNATKLAMRLAGAVIGSGKRGRAK